MHSCCVGGGERREEAWQVGRHRATGVGLSWGGGLWSFRVPGAEQGQPGRWNQETLGTASACRHSGGSSPGPALARGPWELPSAEGVQFPAGSPVPSAPSLLHVHLWSHSSFSFHWENCPLPLLTRVLQRSPLFLNSQACTLSVYTKTILSQLLRGGASSRPLTWGGASEGHSCSFHQGFPRPNIFTCGLMCWHLWNTGWGLGGRGHVISSPSSCHGGEG